MKDESRLGGRGGGRDEERVPWEGKEGSPPHARGRRTARFGNKSMNCHEVEQGSGRER